MPKCPRCNYHFAPAAMWGPDETPYEHHLPVCHGCHEAILRRYRHRQRAAKGGRNGVPTDDAGEQND